MNDTARKPLSGMSLHLRSWAGVALPANELRENMDFGERINHILSISRIILFCRRPHFSFDPDCFSVNDKRISGKLLCHRDGKIRMIPFALEIPLGDDEQSFVLATAPHDDIHILNGQGKRVRKLSAHTLSQHPDILKQEPWVNDLEVLYAGNVYKEGPLSAFARVQNNRALMELLLAMREALPDDDIIVYAFEYLPYELTPLGALMPQVSQTQDARFLSTQGHPLNEYQKTCMEQAALIEYFQPTWNASDKQVSDPESVRVFQSCEILDFSGVVIEISTVRSHFRLYSRTVPPMHHHMNILDLSDPAKRADFFAIKL